MTQILRAGTIAGPNKYASPVIGDRGPTPPVRGRCREATEGIGWRSYGHEVPVGRVPRRSFGFFPIAGKETRCPQAAKSPPAKNHRSGAPGRGPGQPLLPLRGNSPSRALRGGRTLPPHPSGLRPATFPPRGKAEKERATKLPSIPLPLQFKKVW